MAIRVFGVTGFIATIHVGYWRLSGGKTRGSKCCLSGGLLSTPSGGLIIPGGCQKTMKHYQNHAGEAEIIFSTASKDHY